jgi:1-hydroxycarotenoid 3,4-desaturase
MTTVVIGAGAGGLSAAIMLAARGEQVTVLEKMVGAGGKLFPLTFGGHQFDSGPTVFTMRWVLDTLFEAARIALENRIELEPLPVSARHYWSGGQTLDLFADHDRTVDAIGRFAGSKEAKGYASFAADAARIHQSLLKPFLKSQRPSPWGLAAAMPAKDLLSINPFETLWAALGKHFSDPRLRQLFGRYATYCGSSPFKAPATLMLVADVEAKGVWRVKGGMAAVATALESLCRDLGVTFRFGCAAASIETEGSKVSAVFDANGVRHECSSVIVNADSAAVAAGLFGKPASRASSSPAASERSLSAFTWCAVAKTEGAELEHHTVFFSDDYAAEFRELEKGAAKDPTVYICDQGDDRKLILVNAPAYGADAPPDLDARLLDRLKKGGLELNLDPARYMRRGPKEFGVLYPGTEGALYGRATQGWMSTFTRPQSRTKVPGLYLAGGSVHPGPGVPMAMLSGMRAAEALWQDRTSTRR